MASRGPTTDRCSGSVAPSSTGGLCVCVCVSQTLFQREVRFSDERIHDFHDHHAGGHRKPIELCPTKLSMVSSGYQG